MKEVVCKRPAAGARMCPRHILVFDDINYAKESNGESDMIVGIDLGTTNSLVAYYTEDGPKLIPNRFGKNLTPSVVSMDEDEQIYVGDTAVERNLLYPGSAASVFKRDMGSSKKYKLGKKEFTADELSSFVH